MSGNTKTLSQGIIMLKYFTLLCLFVFVSTSAFLSGAGASAAEKKRFMVVSSYHPEYQWSQETNNGFCTAMLKYGYFDSKEQAVELTENDAVETSKAIVKKLWMDTKRKKEKQAIAAITSEFTTVINDYKPDIIMLGDDNAANYIGNQFLDTNIPIVFWGVNNTPVKYGLVDSEEKPGHNVTGVYQSGYYVESLELLKKIKPSVKTFAILSVDTNTGRSHTKKIEYLALKGLLPLQLVDSISTNDFDSWKSKALDLQKKVDALFVAHYSGLEDKQKHYLSTDEVADWYFAHVQIPEAVGQSQFIKQGMLCGADDSGYNQGYEAVVIAHDILAKGADPSTYPPRAPKRGPLMVNRQRAQQLGIKLTDDMGIEEFIDEIPVLKKIQ